MSESVDSVYFHQSPVEAESRPEDCFDALFKTAEGYLRHLMYSQLKGLGPVENGPWTGSTPSQIILSLLNPFKEMVLGKRAAQAQREKAAEKHEAGVRANAMTELLTTADGTIQTIEEFNLRFQHASAGERARLILLAAKTTLARSVDDSNGVIGFWPADRVQEETRKAKESQSQRYYTNAKLWAGRWWPLIQAGRIHGSKSRCERDLIVLGWYAGASFDGHMEGLADVAGTTFGKVERIFGKLFEKNGAPHAPRRIKSRIRYTIPLSVYTGLFMNRLGGNFLRVRGQNIWADEIAFVYKKIQKAILNQEFPEDGCDLAGKYFLCDGVRKKFEHTTRRKLDDRKLGRITDYLVSQGLIEKQNHRTRPAGSEGRFRSTTYFLRDDLGLPFNPRIKSHAELKELSAASSAKAGWRAEV